VYEIRLLHFSSVLGLRKYIRHRKLLVFWLQIYSFQSPMSLSASPKQFSPANVVTWGTLQTFLRAKWLDSCRGLYRRTVERELQHLERIWRWSARRTSICCTSLFKFKLHFCSCV